jgi:ATPase
MVEKIEKLAPDTSVIIEGILSAKLKSGEYEVEQILIHEAVIAELEHQANSNRTIGFLGLEEIKRLTELSKELNFEMHFTGQRPNHYDIRDASLGKIDSIIRDSALAEDATLITADKVQIRVANAKGMKAIYIQSQNETKKIKLHTYFDDTTMSVHLRENVEPYAKKGKPGEWKFVQLKKKKLTHSEVQEISREIIEQTKITKEGFIEIDRPGSTIVQLGKFRIVITRPPFSDGWEITAVRPVKQLTLADYNLSEALQKRVAEQAEGMLVAGAPGMGKSTFAQALAEFYSEQNKIVKTVEAPRDLVLKDNVTQYAISHGTPQEVHDVLLLSRPDYTIFDEMRNTNDFELFADMRLAGVGMVGVVHGTNPVDSIQRFIGRVELGVIPQIIDTVIFIKDGGIKKVLSLQMMVKVPSGMTEADLARPVVVITDFETGKLEYEIYSYGEETVVIPVRSEDKSGAHKLAEESLKREFQRLSDTVEVDVVSANKAIVYVAERDIAKIIGKQGKRITGLEKELGISIEVREFTDAPAKENTGASGKQIPFDNQITKKAVLLFLDEDMANKDIHVFSGEDFLMTTKSGKNATIKISKKNKLGKIVEEELDSGKIRLVAK